MAGGRSVGNRVVSVLVSLALVASCLPAQALAEARDMADGAVVREGGAPAAVSTEVEDDAHGDGAAPGDASEAPVLGAAGEAAVDSGEWGGCSWSLDGDGTLSVWPTDGVGGRLADSGGVWYADAPGFPWYERRADITAVRFAAGVELPGDCTCMFDGCSSLTTLDLSGWDTSSVTGMSYMFSGCSSLASLDVSGWDTSSATDMGWLFYGCTGLSSLDVSHFNTSSVTNMCGMFGGCSGLTSLDVSGWDTSSVTDMGSMFAGCSRLTSLDLSGWDTSSVSSMPGLFYGCTGLASLDLSDWDTSSVTDMLGLFDDCYSLDSLNLSGWDTSSVTDMGWMFMGCSGLTSLDLSGWDTSSVWRMDDMFHRCSSLVTIYVGGRWSTAGLGSSYDDLFYGCESLVGGSGTAYDPAHVGSSYAVVDAEGTPGYLTLGGSAPGQGRREVEVPFLAMCSAKGGRRIAAVAWDEGWFAADPRAYNHELAIAAAALAASAYNEGAVRDALLSLGCAEKDIDAHYGKGGADSVAFAIGSRPLPGGGTLVVVAVRGSEGEEWYSNLNVDGTGRDGAPYHEGFDRASTGVLAALDAHLAERPSIDPAEVKVLFAGHSRGAAVANVAASRLDDGTASGRVAGDDRLGGIGAGDVFAYTIASPATTSLGSRGDGVYGNVFNVVNPEDVVTKLPLRAWGYGRFGVDLTLPSKTNTRSYGARRRAMNRLFSGFDGVDYENHVSGTLVPDLFAVQVLSNAFTVRAFYSGNPRIVRPGLNPPLEPALRSVVKLLVLGQGLGPGEAVAMASGGTGTLLSLLCLGYANGVFNYYSDLLAGGGGRVDAMSISTQALHAHAQETYLSWLQAFDDPGDLFVDAAHLRVTASASGGGAGAAMGALSEGTDASQDLSGLILRVYGPDGELVCSVEGGSIDGSLLADGLAAIVDGESVIVDVPHDAGFRVEVSCAGGSLASVSCETVDGDDGVGSVVSYSGVDASGATLSVSCQPDGDGFDVDATLGGSALAPTHESGSGDTGVEVSVAASGDGWAWGGGSFAPGTFATLCALPYDEASELVGWYRDGEFLGTGRELTLLVESPTEVEARFGRTLALAEVEPVPDVSYTGSAAEPALRVTHSDEELEEGVDYEVSYSDNVSVGTATATLSGLGAYSGSTSVTFEVTMPFSDVTMSTPHVADVGWLAASGISTGWAMADGTRQFRPMNTVIRQDMAAFLFREARLWGLVDDSWQPTGKVTFTDVTPKTPHYREIMWLAESGVSAGWTMKDGTKQFRPTNTVVRQDMAAFLRRMQALRDPSVGSWAPTAGSPFTDVNAKTPHHEDVLWLAESGVSTGWSMPGGTKQFRPTNTVVRQDMAAFLHRLDGLG